MEKTQKIALKGFVLNKKGEILLIKYKSGKYQDKKLKGKLALPGGKLEFGNDAEEALKREVREETGVDVEVVLPFYSWTWTYLRDDEQVQIVAYTWLCYADDDEINVKEVKEKESVLVDIDWYKLEDINLDDVVHDERENFIQFNKYCNSNPFMR